MENSNLIRLLKKLSPRELKRLEDMLASPFFNRSERCSQLFYLIKKAVLEKGGTLGKEQVFYQLFPEKKEKDAALSVLVSRLTGLVKEVVVQEQLRLRPHSWNHLLLQGMSEKSADKFVEKQGLATLKKIRAQQKLTREDLLNQFLITNLLYETEVTRKRNKRPKPVLVAEALDIFYLSHRLPLIYEISNVQQILASSEDVMAGKILSLSLNLDKTGRPLITLYQNAVLLVQEPEELAHFDRFLANLDRFAPAISKEELHSLHSISSNYCIQQIIKGKADYHRHLLDNFKKMIALDVLFITKHIHLTQVKNVVTIACQLGELDWARDFLKTHRMEIAPKSRAQYFDYFSATIYFYAGEFEMARDLLVQKESMEFFFEIGRKFFLLKIYYELKEEIALYQLLDSFKSYIRNNKVLSKNVKDSYLSFAKVLYSLCKARKKGKVKANTLRNKLQSYRQISDKKWLMEKIEELF